jgi:hypothetical protein
MNPADIVSKHWAYPQIWHIPKALLFYSGDPGNLIEKKKSRKKRRKHMPGLINLIIYWRGSMCGTVSLIEILTLRD